MDGYSTTVLSGLTGLSQPRIQYWAKTGFLQPSIQDAGGSGTQRRWSFGDLVAARAAQQLLDQGITFQKLRKAVAHLRERGYDQPLRDVFLVTDGNDVYERQGSGLASIIRKQGQGHFMFVVDLAELVKTVREDIKLAAG